MKRLYSPSADELYFDIDQMSALGAREEAPRFRKHRCPAMCTNNIAEVEGNHYIFSSSVNYQHGLRENAGQGGAKREALFGGLSGAGAFQERGVV